MSSYGINLLDEGNWTPERLGEALEKDLSQLSQSEGRTEPELEHSLTRVLEIVSQHAVWLILEGRFDALRDLSRQISSLFSHFPSLPMLRDLSLAERAGARLDGLLGQLLAVEQLPSRSRAEALFGPGIRGSESRYDAIRCLSEHPEGLSTQELMQQMGIEFRQTVHLILRKLREQGLVVSEPVGSTHHHRLTASGRRLWNQLRERQVAAAPIANVVAPIFKEPAGGQLRPVQRSRRR